MSAITLPTPGGAPVTLPRFAVMGLGAGVGVVLYSNYLMSHVISKPWDKDWFMGFGPNEVFMGACALLGGAAASMLFSKLGK
jgi:hypothetical protein